MIKWIKHTSPESLETMESVNKTDNAKVYMIATIMKTKSNHIRDISFHFVQHICIAMGKFKETVYGLQYKS